MEWVLMHGRSLSVTVVHFSLERHGHYDGPYRTLLKSSVKAHLHRG